MKSLWIIIIIIIIITVVIMMVSLGNVNGKCYNFNGLEYVSLEVMEDAVVKWREDKGDYDEEGNLVSLHEIWEAVDEDGDPVYFTSKSALNRYVVGCCV